MDYNKVRDQFGNWDVVLKEFIESDKFDAIFRFLKQQSKEYKKTIIPTSKDLFKSFSLCDRTKVKVIVLLMDPYPTFKKVKGVDTMVASGIPMSCENTGMSQPTLDQWYGAMTDCYGFNPDMEQRLDLTYLLQEEHVLLLNSSLSVEKDRAGSHAHIWTPFMEHLFTELDKWVTGIPIVLCGSQAQKYEKYINPLIHYILKVEHPVAASYANRGWDHKCLFKWCNEIIKNNNGEEHQIKWWRNRVWQDSSKPRWEDRDEYGNLKNKEDDEWKSDLPWDN